MASRTNEQWLDEIRSAGQAREMALADLRAYLLEGLPYALGKWIRPEDPLLPPLIEDVVQETLLRVVARLDTFEGRSLFTTWASKIAVRFALTELRRLRWRDVSLKELSEETEESVPFQPADPEPGPERIVEQMELLARVERLIGEELTEKQRQAMIAMGFQGVPMDEVARRMGMQRNALYKLLHDARLRLKRRLAQEGLTPQDVLAAFEK